MKHWLIILVGVIFLSTGCATTLPQYEGQAATRTGVYKLFRAGHKEVRSLASSRMAQYHGLCFNSFTDWELLEIWYSNNHGRDLELYNASSYKNLRMEALRDQERLQEARVNAMKRWLNGRW